MELAELLKALVETEDKMERMSLVEANQEHLNQSDEGEGDAGTGEDWEAKYHELEKKYIDTFFGGTNEGEGNSENNDDTNAGEDEETKRAESITIDDLYKKED